MNHIEWAIIQTLTYTDMFQQALSEDELNRFLIGQKASKAQLQQTNSDKFLKRHGLYVLPHSKSALKAKKNQHLIQQQKMNEFRKHQWVLEKIPWVKFAGLTGSVAGGSPQRDDDIDLFIITDRKRLWITRLCVVAILNLYRIRRKPHDNPSKVANKWCLNMWSTIDSLTESKQDLYTAMEIAHIIPVINKQSTYEAYLNANKWLSIHLPNVLIPKLQTHQYKSVKKTLANTSLDWLENMLEKLWKSRMIQTTHETVTSTELKFHPKNYHQHILTTYAKRMKDWPNKNS